MESKILLIGNTSESHLIGFAYSGAAKALNLPFLNIDTSWNSSFPSMKTILGKTFFKLTNKRPIEWWQFNRNIVNTIKKFRPQIVLVTGILPLIDEVFITCSQIGAVIANYLTDDPWNPNHTCTKFLSNLKQYDLVISTKTRIISDLNKHGVKKNIYTPMAYNPYVCYQPKQISPNEKDLFTADIAFIGTGDIERLPYLEAIASLDLDNLQLKIYGNNWNKIPIQTWQTFPAVFENEFRLAIHCSKLSLGIVRKRNRDESTRRTFEIAACGGCGIYEDTKEHREILAGYPEYGFFSSADDLANKCKWLLHNPAEREKMRNLGMQILVKDANTFTTRLKTILDLCGN